MKQQQVSHIPRRSRGMITDGQSTDADVVTKLCSLSLTFHSSSIVADQHYDDNDTDADKNRDDYVQQ